MHFDFDAFEEHMADTADKNRLLFYFKADGPNHFYFSL